jgi:hypothetical protein
VRRCAQLCALLRLEQKQEPTLFLQGMGGECHLRNGISADVSHYTTLCRNPSSPYARFFAFFGQPCGKKSTSYRQNASHNVDLIFILL